MHYFAKLFCAQSSVSILMLLLRASSTFYILQCSTRSLYSCFFIFICPLQYNISRKTRKWTYLEPPAGHFKKEEIQMTVSRRCVGRGCHIALFSGRGSRYTTRFSTLACRERLKIVIEEKWYRANVEQKGMRSTEPDDSETM